MPRSLHPDANLEVHKKEAKELLRAHKNRDASSCRTIRLLRGFEDKSDAEILAADLQLADIQHALAIDYGFTSWALLKQYVESSRQPSASQVQLGPIGRLNDEVRERITLSKIEDICRQHGLAKPVEILPEPDGNDTVVYYLNQDLVLSFHCHKPVFEEVSAAMRIAEHIPAFPSPRIIASVTEDQDLGMPYVVAERCPGQRLDRLWHAASPNNRLAIATALGKGMGLYHTVDREALETIAESLSLSQYVRSAEVGPAERGGILEIQAEFGKSADVIHQLGANTAHVAESIQTYCARLLADRERPFVGPGLIHECPWPNHYFIAQNTTGYSLSGCINSEGLKIADSLDEIGGLYATMLGVDDALLAAFRHGYEESFKFPPSAERMILDAAIEFDAWGLIHMTRSRLPREERVPEWLKRWILNRFHRLEGWFEPSKRVQQALFRGQVGPW